MPPGQKGHEERKGQLFTALMEYFYKNVLTFIYENELDICFFPAYGTLVRQKILASFVFSNLNVDYFIYYISYIIH